MKPLKTLGQIARRLRRQTPAEEREGFSLRQPPASQDPTVRELLARARDYADETMQQLSLTERWQLRPELERILEREVHAEWTPNEVQELVDAVFRAWGLRQR